MDCYKVLKIPKDATKDEIKRAYKKLVLEYHPDRNRHGEEAFLLITMAYTELMREKSGKKTAASTKIARKPPIAKVREKIHHNMSFVTGHIKRSMVWAPDFHLFRRANIAVESRECETCGGSGKLLDRPGISIPCPICGGTGHKTRIVNI